MQSNPWKLDWKNELQLCKSVVCEGSVLLECPNACGLAHAVQPNGLKAAWQLGGEEHVWEMLARRLIPLLSAVNFLASESAAPVRRLAHHSCQGYDEEVGGCEELPACSVCQPQDCVFSPWNSWYDAGGCIGLKFRERSKATSNNECGKPCSGALLESESFVQDKCVKKVTDCMFGVWSEWTPCHSSADQSVRSRSIVQQPTDTGRPCEGPTKLTRPCGTSKQPIACQFSPWREWTTCSSTCGEGRHTRLRRIDQDALHGGDICVGVLLETVPCSLPPCGRSDCRVTTWSSWSDCAEETLCFQRHVSVVVTSLPQEGQTQRLRRRTVQQMPAGGGLVCPTELVVTAGCPAAPPQNCSLTDRSPDPVLLEASFGLRSAKEWTPWTSCDKTCDGGQSYRERQLNQPSSAKGFCPASVMKESIQSTIASWVSGMIGLPVRPSAEKAKNIGCAG
eukprot:s1399_g20.t1